MAITEKAVQSSAKIGEGARQIHKAASGQISGIQVASTALGPLSYVRVDARSEPVVFTGPLHFTVKVDSRHIVGLASTPSGLARQI